MWQWMNLITAIKKNEIKPFAATMMYLEIIILNEISQIKTNILYQEFLLWLSGLGTQLVFLRMQVRYLASFSGLRIWHCCKLWGRSRCGLDPVLLWQWRRGVGYGSNSTPIPGTSICCRCNHKKKKKKYIYIYTHTHNITCMWNIQNLHKLSYIQNKNKPTDIENKLSYQKGNEERDKLGSWD